MHHIFAKPYSVKRIPRRTTSISSGETIMFGLFKKSIHEPVSKQREDLAMYPGPFAEMIVGGEDCDELSAGSGPFGSQHNPIPVNGALGEIKYLGKLRGKTAHRLT
jgi:hypothetical protein